VNLLASKRISQGPPRSKELHPCENCGELWHPTKSQLMRGNELFCGEPECRRAAWRSYRMRVGGWR